MQVGTSVGAPSHGERVGVFAVAVVKRGRSGMTGGVALSVTLCLKMNFLFFSNG